MNGQWPNPAKTALNLIGLIATVLALPTLSLRQESNDGSGSGEGDQGKEGSSGGDDDSGASGASSSDDDEDDDDEDDDDTSSEISKLKRRMKAADKRASKESKEKEDLKKKLREFEDKDKGDAEKMSRDLEEVTQERDTLKSESEKKDAKIRRLEGQVELGDQFKNKKLALKAAEDYIPDHTDEDGEVNWKKVAKAVAKDYPELVADKKSSDEEGGEEDSADSGGKQRSGPPANSGKKADSGQPDRETLRKKYSALRK